MDFFGWVNLPLLLIGLFSTVSDDATPGDVAAMVFKENLICLAIGAALFIAVLILGGIGLNTLAKKEGIKPSVCAYLPFANTYFAGKIAGETNFFRTRVKRAGLYAMICEFLYTLIEGVRIVLNLLLTRGEYYMLQTIEGIDIPQWSLNPALIPAEKRWQYDLINYSQYFSYLFYIFAVIFLCMLFVKLFRKYYARGPVIMTILCTFFPFRGFVLFAVRKNSPIDYDRYMRMRYGYPPYPGNGGGTPPSEPPQWGGTPQGDDPFADYKETKPSDDDVFKDF